MSKPLVLGTLTVKALHFSLDGSTHRYVVGVDDMDFLDFHKKYNHNEFGPVDCKKATGFKMDETYDDFFMVYVEDCFDPPIAIIRAEHGQEAAEIFTDELTWAHVDEKDVTDEQIDAGLYQMNNNGKWYDAETLRVRNVRLVYIEVV